jgi:hypothetical protein
VSPTGEPVNMKLDGYIYVVNGPLQIRVVRAEDEFESNLAISWEVVEDLFQLNNG